MSINKKEEDKLQHDVKRLSIGINLICCEESESKRKYLLHLMNKEVERLYEDIAELVQNSGGD